MSFIIFLFIYHKGSVAFTQNLNEIEARRFEKFHPTQRRTISIGGLIIKMLIARKYSRAAYFPRRSSLTCNMKRCVTGARHHFFKLEKIKLGEKGRRRTSYEGGLKRVRVIRRHEEQWAVAGVALSHRYWSPGSRNRLLVRTPLVRLCSKIATRLKDPPQPAESRVENPQ